MDYQSADLPGCADSADRIVAPAGGAVARCASRARFVLGMPQLDACGLSEQWLQRTCGDRHWQALARLSGHPSENWRDDRGRRVYAAFAYLRLGDARLAAATEGQSVTLRSESAALGRAKAWSQHRLTLPGGTPLACLDMLSVFVSRADGRSNRSIRRTDMRMAAASCAPTAAAAVLERARALRQQAAESCAAHDRPPLRFAPCPRNDFNGAGLLYFSSFTAFADRALWQWGLLAQDDAVLARECAFLGNLDVGGHLSAVLVEASALPGGRALAVALTKSDDGAVLAIVRLHTGRRATRVRDDRFSAPRL
jgi:probable biosynthetic protein (TIGR04099 family)